MLRGTFFQFHRSSKETKILMVIFFFKILMQTPESGILTGNHSPIIRFGQDEDLMLGILFTVSQPRLFPRVRVFTVCIGFGKPPVHFVIKISDTPFGAPNAQTKAESHQIKKNCDHGMLFEASRKDAMGDEIPQATAAVLLPAFERPRLDIYATLYDDDIQSMVDALPGLVDKCKQLSDTTDLGRHYADLRIPAFVISSNKLEGAFSPVPLSKEHSKCSSRSSVPPTRSRNCSAMIMLGMSPTTTKFPAGTKKAKTIPTRRGWSNARPTSEWSNS
jgi:hypothetical protein